MEEVVEETIKKEIESLNGKINTAERSIREHTVGINAFKNEIKYLKTMVEFYEGILKEVK